MNQSTPASGYAVAGISGLALILIMLLFAWFATPFNGWDAFKAFHDWVLFFLMAHLATTELPKPRPKRSSAHSAGPATKSLIDKSLTAV